MPLSAAIFALTTAAPLVPTGPWNVDADVDQCVLARQYGPAEDRTLIAFQPILGQGQMDFVLATRGRPGQQDTGKATVLRLPDGQAYVGTYVRLSTLATGQQVTRISLSRALFDDLGKGTELRVQAGSLSRHVAIGKSDKARVAFADCERDLLKSWGVDPAYATGPLAARPVGAPDRYFRPESYPKAARDKGFIGRVTAVLNIDPSGAVIKCRPIVSAGEALTAATCANAMKIPFTPGSDLTGKAVASVFVLRVAWQLGNAMPDWANTSRIAR